MQQLTPFIPSSESPYSARLFKRADELVMACSGLSAGLHHHVLDEIKRITLLVNNYYSNLIESEGTHPVDIYRAMLNNFSTERTQRSKQHLALAYSEAQNFVFSSGLDFTEYGNILKIHAVFYGSQHLLDEHKRVLDAKGCAHFIVPGHARQALVEVGSHLAPEPEALPHLFRAFHQHYQLSQNDLMYQQIIKTFAAHHRFMYIHPFLDGNGRTGRLITDGMLNQIFPETYGLWSLSRGLARSNESYKQWLARADQIRQGERDGRGMRTEVGLVEFIEFMITTASDQVHFMKAMLKLSALHERIKQFVLLSQNTDMFQQSVPIEMLKLIPALLVDGEIRKGDLPGLIGCSERKARMVSKQLVSAGMLYDDAKFAPFKLRLPERALPYIFPNLVPFLDQH
jgi:Fic family protein